MFAKFALGGESTACGKKEHRQELRAGVSAGEGCLKGELRI